MFRGHSQEENEKPDGKSSQKLIVGFRRNSITISRMFFHTMLLFNTNM